MPPGLGPAALGQVTLPARRAMSRRLAAGVAAAAVAAAASRLDAQAVLGGFEDATVPRRGEVRVRILGAFTSFSERYGGMSGGADGEARPLGATYDFAALGPTQLPMLGQLQSALAGLTEGTPAAVSLGRTRSEARAAIITAPFAVDVGVTRRLSVGIVIPVVRARQSVDVRFDPDTAAANVGFNPLDPSAFSASIAGEAAARNVALRDQLTGASQALQQLLTRCPPSAPGESPSAECRAVDANRAGATALVGAATTFRDRVGRVYGTSAAAFGSRFVPVAGSPLQRQVEQRVAALGRGFRAFGVTQLTDTIRPTGSPARIAFAGLQRIITAPEFGVGADTLRSTTRSGTGDIDIAATALLVDTFGEGTARLAPAGVRVRAAVTAGYRFGFDEGGDIPSVFFELPVATGGSALLVRGAADVAFGRRAWATAVARLTAPFADELITRVTDVPEQPFPELARTQQVARQLGRTLELELSPRYSFGEYLAVAGHYALRDHAEDRFTGTFTADSVPGQDGPLAIDAATLGIATAAREQRVGFGLTYSTVAAHVRGKTGVPIEISYLHTETLSGSGGTPKGSTDVLQVRLYLRLFGRR